MRKSLKFGHPSAFNRSLVGFLEKHYPIQHRNLT